MFRPVEARALSLRCPAGGQPLRNIDGQIFLSASDLMRFAGCAHATALDLGYLRSGPALEPREDSEDAELLQRRGNEHEAAYLETLKRSGRRVVELTQDKVAEDAERTRAALASGAEVVFQGAFLSAFWGGWADFIERVETPSDLGPFSYEVADTKLKRTPHPKHVLQLVLYSDLLAEVQGRVPERAHVQLGDGTRWSFALSDYAAYARAARARLEAFIADPPPTRPTPCSDCGLCRWGDHCQDDVGPGRQPVQRRRHREGPGEEARGGEHHHDAGARPAPEHGARHGGRHARPAADAGAPPACPQDRRAGPRAPPARAGPRLRSPARAGGRRPLLRHRGRPASRGRPRIPPRGVGRRRLPELLGARPRGREGRGQKPPRRLPRPARRLPRGAHLPLRPLRDHRAPPADSPLRRRRGLPRPAAPRAPLRRPLRRGARRDHRLGAGLLAQVAGGLLRPRTDRRGQDGRRLGGRLRAVARDRRPDDPRRDRGLQPRRLHLDRDAPRLAGGRPAGGHAVAAARQGRGRAGGRRRRRRGGAACPARGLDPLAEATADAVRPRPLPPPRIEARPVGGVRQRLTQRRGNPRRPGRAWRPRSRLRARADPTLDHADL